MKINAKIEHAILKTCEKHSVSKLELLSGRRERRLVDARRECARILRGHGLSFPEIGLAMNRDHSSIVHLLKPTPSHKPVNRAV